MIDENNFDPIRYGALWQRVQDYERRFDQMDKNMDRINNQMTQLLEMANRSKGAIWFGIGIWSVLTGVFGFFFGKH